MELYWLRFQLLSDATFGRGEGLAGVVDQEVDHDALGLPYLRGRNLKGLLNEECANLLYALDQAPRWAQAAQRLWGGPGSQTVDAARLHVGDAQLPVDLRLAVEHEVQAERLHPMDVLESLTTIRRQTAVDELSGAPDDGTLRAMRVVLRKAEFEAPLTFTVTSERDDRLLLAACVLALRRAGTGRNRGRGRLLASLHADDQGRPGEDLSPALYHEFAEEVRG
jgi:hypothetical protein